MEEYVHPETGEVLATEEAWRAALAAVEERLAPIYRTRRALRDAYTERFPPAALPSRRGRTDTQALIARCPRCGSRLESERAAQEMKPPSEITPHSPQNVVTSKCAASTLGRILAHTAPGHTRVRAGVPLPYVSSHGLSWGAAVGRSVSPESKSARANWVSASVTRWRSEGMEHDRGGVQDFPSVSRSTGV